MPDDDWIASLGSVKAYDGIDIALELSKAQRWCERNNRKCTRRFFEGWLTRADRVIAPRKQITEQFRGCYPVSREDVEADRKREAELLQKLREESENQ